MKKKWFWLTLVMLMLLSVLPASASASDSGVIEITTAKQLMAVLESNSSSTYGKTYVLQNDITIDTSGLETSYLAGYGNKRLFHGILDGGGHTITVFNGEGAAAKPLFDSISGEYGNYAGVKNLKVVFKNDVAGTTIAAHTSYVRISDVDISFERDIVFAKNSSGYAIATGVYGFTANGIDVRLEDVRVTATGEAPYGIIGSKDAQNARYVLASGIFSEINSAGGKIVCDGIDVNVRGIYAVSEYIAEDYYSSCCAAGVSGYFQSNLRIANANINVANDISASTIEGSTSDADAYGLCFKSYATYNCHVNVGGNIEAKACPDGYEASFDFEADVCAAGMGYEIMTRDNDMYFGQTDSGSCSVKVGGDIVAETNGGTLDSGNYPSRAVAFGVAQITSHNYTWKNVTVEAANISAVANDTRDAYAAGFAYINFSDFNRTTDSGDYINCTVSAGNIQAVSERGNFAQAAGFMIYQIGSSNECTINAGEISSSGNIALTSGFTITFYPYREDTIGVAENCKVYLDRLTAHSDDIAAVVSGLMYDSVCTIYTNNASSKILDCSVDIAEAMEASGEAGDKSKALLLYLNSNKAELRNNTVTLPKSQADVQNIDGVDYVLFTASELEGQADTEGWESGNRVIFTGESINSVSCAFDDSNKTYGTLWELTLVSRYFTLSYNSNGGTKYEDELHLEGTEVQLDKVPERDGHTFTGWFADEDLTQQIATITMNDHSTVHAGWEKDEEPWTPPITTPETPTEPSEPDYTPNWLNTTDHVSYIIGYEDGTVKPGAGITRAEVATIFFRLLTDGARERFWSETNAYTDVASGSWYNIAVSTLSNMGILGGYEDGTFRPNASITRAEFAKIAVSFFDWADVYAVNSFVDVRNSAWYANYVAVAAEIGLIEGYGGNVFRPDATITRAEACTIINRTLGRAPDADHLLPVSQMNTWPDNADTGVWYYAHIQEATNSHEYSWSGDIEQWTEKLPEPDWDALQR